MDRCELAVGPLVIAVASARARFWRWRAGLQTLCQTDIKMQKTEAKVKYLNIVIYSKAVLYHATLAAVSYPIRIIQLIRQLYQSHGPCRLRETKNINSAELHRRAGCVVTCADAHQTEYLDRVRAPSNQFGTATLKVRGCKLERSQFNYFIEKMPRCMRSHC